MVAVLLFLGCFLKRNGCNDSCNDVDGSGSGFHANDCGDLMRFMVRIYFVVMNCH